ncbi:hypothetical protein NSA11_08765 [Lactobacillus taiwanensis]|uniref:hypothetical protein n=1 Tax=Lactobacillus taiwanensis TaxID=508451 RepID=UPI00214AC35E|nr:hypothetical protein [Lactobacillus taiwanensis]MCR1904005.1 hypothetical protein [Lactobacillus taiwanensis]
MDSMIYSIKKSEKKSTFFWIKKLATIAGLFYFGAFYLLTKYPLHTIKGAKYFSNLSLLAFMFFELIILISFLKGSFSEA